MAQVRRFNGGGRFARNSEITAAAAAAATRVVAAESPAEWRARCAARPNIERSSLSAAAAAATLWPLHIVYIIVYRRARALHSLVLVGFHFHAERIYKYIMYDIHIVSEQAHARVCADLPY